MGENENDFVGKVAIVTGGSRGIGRLLTTLLSARGAHVLFCGRSGGAVAEVERELTLQGHDVVGLAVDVSSHASCKKLVETAADRWGTIDILVNNAGLSGVHKPIQDLSYDEFDEVVRSNQYAAYSCIHFASTYMIAQRSGSIVNISSTAARHAVPRRTPYISAKLGLIGITRAAAIDLAPHQVTCNAVSPGAVHGQRMDEVIARQAAASGTSVAEAIEEARLRIPMREHPTERDVCDAVLLRAT
jgi:NAD(P)-dependent dehydrogenase (short-subunit alcohol dehydrogenase family)